VAVITSYFCFQIQNQLLLSFILSPQPIPMSSESLDLREGCIAKKILLFMRFLQGDFVLGDNPIEFILLSFVGNRRTLLVGVPFLAMFHLLQLQRVAALGLLGSLPRRSSHACSM
jgi:hypothetical protein